MGSRALYPHIPFTPFTPLSLPLILPRPLHPPLAPPGSSSKCSSKCNATHHLDGAVVALLLPLVLVVFLTEASEWGEDAVYDGAWTW